jgi:hypothetical protein
MWNFKLWIFGFRTVYWNIELGTYHQKGDIVVLGAGVVQQGKLILLSMCGEIRQTCRMWSQLVL